MSLTDFNFLYQKLCNKDEIYVLNCKQKKKIVPNIGELINQKKSYVCCLYNDLLQQCILHQCVVIALQSWLDKKFRDVGTVDEDEQVLGCCFVMNRTLLHHSKYMMNNNIQLHNFRSPQFSSDAKRLYLYGNFCPEGDVKRYGQSIQLVYESSNNELHVRDVYGQDYFVDDKIIEKIFPYFQNNYKWPELGFLFDNIDSDLIKFTMRHICTDYHIDTLSNKLILSPSQLLETFLLQTKKFILYLIDKQIPVAKLVKDSSRSMMQSIVDGQIFKGISKTLSTQKIFKMNPRLQEHTSRTNRDVNVFDLNFKNIDEILKIVSKDVSYKANMQYSDYRYFIDHCDHGELHAAGKTFTKTHDVILPNIDYSMILRIFTSLINDQLISTSMSKYRIIFNSCPTQYFVHNVEKFVKTIKLSTIEIRMFKSLMCLNYHVGLIMKKAKLFVDNEYIDTYVTPFELHHESSCFKNKIFLNDSCVKSLLSRTTLFYCNEHTDIFASIPPAKIMVFMRNLKNASPVFVQGSFVPTKYTKFMKNENKNCIIVDPKHYCNDKMIYLWTIIGDDRLKTTEDPYVPNFNQPFVVYNLRSIILRGTSTVNKNAYFRMTNNVESNVLETLYGYRLIGVCQITSQNAINWNTLGKKIKITSLKSKTMYIYKIMMYLHDNFDINTLDVKCEFQKINKEYIIKIRHVFKYENYVGIKLCSVHGQKGVLNTPSNLNCWTSEDGINPQLMISPISFLNRETVLGVNIDKKIVYNGDSKAVMYRIPYTLFYATPDDAHTEYCDKIKTGLEKVEGTRLDNYTINNHYVSNRQILNLQDIRANSHDQNFDNENYNTAVSLINTWHVRLD
ncbi:late expression factor 8 [Neodiprion abietis nucleopolyhedrovirus]|uniref:DNA-directed RNA polymerase n=1 Tax=Neodiprion abietis nucleopolyhedrovirus TaxID=204507 RepID=Q0ZNZ7_9CBAC|nr:late expression factor 8 [Neodiprion abietis nucleopolyhedrovirus]ABC74957.1 late expression factor 8 [Neodiprion abietis nucleopolyhedrovirus]